MNNMILIIGLGNPRKKFEKTRHNVGFRAVAAFQAKDGFSDFKFSKKFKAEISEGILDSKKIVLAKPQTFMNDSGKAVKILNTKYKIQNTNLWVIHDDIDLPFGKIKIVKSRGAAGHKGVESIIRELKNKNFIRFRIGIKPDKTENKKQKTEKFVLENFKKAEEKILEGVVKKAIETIEVTIKQGIEKAMNQYNK
jgi:PTH1 family peptidyl-tRNA hydrolase